MRKGYASFDFTESRQDVIAKAKKNAVVHYAVTDPKGKGNWLAPLTGTHEQRIIGHGTLGRTPFVVMEVRKR
jgi:hypothetical protein